MIETLLVADSPAPVINTAWALMLVTRVLHIACAAIMFGGLVYLKVVVAPLAEGAEDRDVALFHGRRSAWAKLVMSATLFLLLSGTVNILYIVNAYEKLPSTYHMLFGIKVLIAVFVFFVAAATAGSSEAAMRMRANLGKWLSMALVATVLVFVIGATLRSFDKVPRAMEEPAAGADVADENS